ncbi:MAG: hypothetical protein OEM81_13940 [Acidimicrobiia bacterium]|nr:hypothetical protein [Acidimicrobiia bacterium]MDH3398914.1 hypothetical protein [Acidimicrobiia bacterium]
MIRWRGVLIGTAAGLLSTVVSGLLASLVTGALGATDPFSLGIVLGAVLGLFIAGFTAAKFVFDRWPLHGSLAALLTAAVVGTDALLRGSGAAPLTLAGYALLAALLGRAGGYVGGRGER